tara:strand:- start:1044 stop:1229 length:186 start_codon:yes stop_codon:yes gene_type:complete
MKTFAMALKLVRSYSATIVLAYELLVMIEETGRDKRITPKERSILMKKFWEIVASVKLNMK